MARTKPDGPGLPARHGCLPSSCSKVTSTCLTWPALPHKSISSAARQELAEARGRPAEEVIESERHALSMQLFESCARVTHAVKDLREQLDLLLTHRVWGYLFLGGMLAAFFGMVYGAGSLLEPPILRLFDQITDAATSWLGATGLASTIVTGLLQGLSGGVAIVLPYLLPFLIGMAILEDVGYLPRVAYLMDSLMHRIGLHGVAIVPAILGYGCNVPAVMATRILTSSRDRFIAAVISTMVPCSARMTVIFGLVAFYLGPFWALAIYALNIIVVAGSGKLLSMIMPESSPGLILEVPPYHVPKCRVVLSKTWLRLREFIVVAWPVLIAGSVVLSLAEHYHWDTAVNHALASFTSLLGIARGRGYNVDLWYSSQRVVDDHADPGTGYAERSRCDDCFPDRGFHALCHILHPLRGYPGGAGKGNRLETDSGRSGLQSAGRNSCRTGWKRLADLV